VTGRHTPKPGAEKIDINEAYRYLAAKEEEAACRAEEKRRAALAALRRALAEVAPGFAVEKIYLYGSLLSAGRWRHGSDIDLAVEGDLGFEEMLCFWCELDRRLPYEVDLKKLGGLSFAEKIKREGLIIYERKNTSAVK